VSDDAPIAAAAAAKGLPRDGYVFAGGGTGGHLFPAIAVARALREREPDCGVVFVGTDRPAERTILAEAGFPHLSLPLLARSQGLRRPFAFAAALWRSCRRMRQLFVESPPRVVVGCGGWSSVPAVWGARQTGIPIVLLEQNVLPGQATRRLSRWANVICLSFDESRQWFGKKVNAVVTGNPVRQEIADLWRPAGNVEAEPVATSSMAAAVSPHSRPMLLVLGGSLGSETINRQVVAGLRAEPEFWRDWEVVHQTGYNDCARVRDEYAQLGRAARVEPFLADVAECLSRATIVVCRAGATTLAELACAGVAAVVVPWRGAADDHQQLNARWYADRNAMRCGREDGGFWGLVLMLAKYPDCRARRIDALRSLARPNATRAVLQVLDATTGRLAGCPVSDAG
jgi:UDP-N-acetylglucosamine--N-acetylmuramyl-(pentapeptide) pyrophosphoryl-undecaprenol N-acetylglucosamine transferase